MKGQTGRQGAACNPGAVVGHLPVPLNLSKQAKLRLRWMDYYHTHKDASLTCRHFGITRSLFYKWKQRYDRLGPRGLENASKRPARVRTPTTPTVYVDLIRGLRRAHPEYSKYKLAVILERDCGVALSASTIGRIITQYNLFFERSVGPKRVRYRGTVRRRLPQGLTGVRPGELVEVDVKHLPVLGAKRYAFVAIDRATRRTSIHVSTSISSRQGAVAWAKATARLGLTAPAVLTDNGSENLGAFAQLLQDAAIPHYFARPHTPKDKPYVERVIGTLERECIQWGGLAWNVAEQQAAIDAWLEKYHAFRPHQALGYLTPDAYAAKLEAEVSTML
jgi:transposase InsO family protein